MVAAPNLRRRNELNFGRLLALMMHNKGALFVLNIMAILFLFSRNQMEFNNYYDFGGAAADCPEQPPNVAAVTGSTTHIVEKNDPKLHETATVMAMATGYHLEDYQRFVGSLRITGFLGNIILVVAPDIGQEEESYLNEKNVIIYKPTYVNCTHPLMEKIKDNTKNSHDKEMITCVHPYPKLKHRWARFPLLRDLLKDCGGKPNPEIQCGGPVLITDMRDTFFQRNPFGPEAPKVYGLQVFEEHYTIRTTHWLVDWPVGECKDVHYDEPMLCSGTTIGTRQAMLDYLEIFHKEMNVWMKSPKCCCFNTNGDDQSMHNYMYYSGMLDGVSGGVHAVKNRDGLVNTVGAMGSLIHNTHRDEKNKLLKASNASDPNGGNTVLYDLSNEEDKKKSKNWLGLHYGMTDKDGLFVQYDGSRSFVIHQIDRFGHQFWWWLDDNKHLWQP